jgi:hypothetical protein
MSDMDKKRQDHLRVLEGRANEMERRANEMERRANEMERCAKRGYVVTVATIALFAVVLAILGLARRCSRDGILGFLVVPTRTLVTLVEQTYEDREK